MPRTASRTRWVLDAARRRPGLLLAGLALAVVLSLAASQLAPRRYRASARLQAQWSDPAVGQSPNVAEELAKRRLRAVRERMAAVAAVERVRLGVPSARAALRSAQDGSYLIETEDADPSRAALLANRLADGLVAGAERDRLAAGGADREALEASLAAARRTMEEAQEALRRHDGAKTPGSDAVPTLERLVRGYEEAREAFFDAEKRLTAAQTAPRTGVGGARFTVLAGAPLPSAVLPGGRTLLAVLGAVLGVAAGLALAVLAELRDPRIKGPEDLAGAVPYPLLAEIPLVPGARAGRGRRRR